ncbi:MAG: S8 family serine peptidase [Gemmatimonadetes bacterium]|nr:S8 family serine peptidase [Gemmatimonadota bacterium]
MGTLLALSILAGAAEAQQPTVSPAVERLLQRDSTVAVWLFVRPAYPLEDVADAVVRAGGTVRRRSEWLHALSANVTRAALSELRRDLRLERIQPVARFRRPPLPPPGAIPPVPRAPPITAQDSLYGPSAMPFRRLNLFPLVEDGRLVSRGYRGAGVRIAMLDTGFETGHPAFASAKVIAQRDFVFNDAVVSNQPNDAAGASRHGTATWSLLAANVPGTLIGIAPEAQYILAKTEDVRSETHAEEDNFVAALEWAASLDAKVVSASLGYLVGSDFGYTFSQLNGDIAVTTIASDLAAQRGITVVNSVGNDGPNPRTLGTPADGDSVIAVGAEDSTGTLAAFSSRGPTADGRIKPDVTAPGVQVWVLDTQAAGGFSRLNGTSFAAPLIAGAAALLREIHPQLTGVEVGDALRRAGNGAPRPDNNRGWGLPDGLTAATFPYGIVVSSPRDSLLTAVTPTFAWSTPGVPPFGNPVSYRLTVSRADTSPQVVLLDTALSSTQATLGLPQRPGRRLSFALQALSADSAVLAFTPDAQFVVPAWADLLTLDDPGGTTVRDPRPTLRWTAPAVVSPPGPFTFDVEVFRTDNREVVIRRTGLDTTAHTLTSDLELNTPYRWRVVSHLGSDTATTESQGAFVVVDGSVPPVTLLFQNFPNPFPNPGLGLSTTCIWFDLATSGSVRLEILDLRGHRVRTLIPGDAFPDPLPAGRYGRPGGAAGGRCDANLEWDGRAEDDTVVPQGVYLVKLATPDGTFFKRIVFLGLP